MNYKGFTYSQELDCEPNEVTKIYHNVTTPDGRTVHLDWSPYSTPTKNDFELWVDLGLPDRMHPSLGERRVYCPLNRNDLFKIKMDIMSLLIIGV
jgi:hypothetical protein